MSKKKWKLKSKCSQWQLCYMRFVDSTVSLVLCCCVLIFMVSDSAQDKKYYPTPEEVYGPEVEVNVCSHKFYIYLNCITTCIILWIYLIFIGMLVYHHFILSSHAYFLVFSPLLYYPYVGTCSSVLHDCISFHWHVHTRTYVHVLFHPCRLWFMKKTLSL